MHHPDHERLALAALPAEPLDPAVEAHLQQCPGCRDDVAALRRTVELARSGDTQNVETPPSRVWEGIVDELATDGHDSRPAGSTADRPRGRWWRSVAVPAAAAVLGVGVGLGIGALPTDTVARDALAPLRSVSAAAPTATGSAELALTGSVQEVRVRVDGVAADPGGDHLEAWLIDSTGTRLVPLGPLVPDGTGFEGRFRVPSGLPTGEFATVDVSAERWDGDPAHSQLSLVRGTLA